MATRAAHHPKRPRAIINIVEPLGIPAHDQIIVGKNGHASWEA
jgi:DNA repair protein RadC